MDHTPTPPPAGREELYRRIAEQLGRGAVERRLLHRVRHVEPEVAEHQAEAIAAGMAPEDWACWYADELDATFRTLAEPTPQRLSRAAIAAAPVVLHG